MRGLLGDRSLPPAVGWAVAGGTLGAGAVLTVMLAPRMSSIDVEAVALLVATGFLAASGALTETLRGSRLGYRPNPGAHGVVWGAAVAVALGAAFLVVRSEPAVPDYAMATVGLTDRWPIQWRAIGIATAMLGPLSGIGSAVVMRLSGVPIRPTGLIGITFGWAAAWLLLVCVLLFVVAAGGGVSLVGAGISRLEVPIIALFTAALGGVGGWVAGLLAEGAIRRASA